MKIREDYKISYRRKASLMAVLLGCLFALALVASPAAASLQIHFYSNSCPAAEFVVKKIVKGHFLKDPSVPAGLLRLHFHDCIVRGCDGSVLLDSHGDSIAEKEAPPNLSLRGFEIIDEIKAELERTCPGIVSCADILALATRDGVALSGGSAYALPTGRRDGTISSIADVHIPDPASSVDIALSAFQSINLNLTDLVTLLGAHSIGFCHCLFFIDRLYSFLGTGFPDPSMEHTTLDALRKQCPPPTTQITNISSDPKVFINQMSNSPFRLDNSFYHAVLNGRAVLQLDQELAFNSLTNDMLVRFASNPMAFRKKFSKSMIKLGNVGVLTGNAGEIRRNCRKVNGLFH